VIQGKVPELERWSMAAARLEQIASDVRTTRAWTLFILVVAVALAVASLVMASRYQRDLVRAQESAGRAIEAMVRAVTDRRSTPIVVGVNPLAGPTAGGTPVRIRGRNFDQRTTVRFGDALANAITTMSADVILASTPAGPSGPCDITVQNWDGGVDTRRDGYTFMAAPVIQGVFPSTSPIAAPCSRYSAPISSRTRPCSSTASGLPRCTSPRTTLPASSHPAQRIRR
jgi:type II secretory pathway pseudopilin PulG